MSQVEQSVAPTTDFNKAMEQLFSEQDPMGRRHTIRHARAWRPPTDLCETDEAIIARIEIAGMRGCQLNVSITDRILIVSGIRPMAAPQGAYHQMEIQYGEFVTELRLPSSVDEEKVEASYEDGFLTVVMPRRQALRIPVR